MPKCFFLPNIRKILRVKVSRIRKEDESLYGLNLSSCLVHQWLEASLQEEGVSSDKLSTMGQCSSLISSLPAKDPPTKTTTIKTCVTT